MKRYLAYARYLIRHIRYVRKACWKKHLYWQGLVHDASKWRPSEFLPYARTFYDADGKNRYEESDAFDAAWNLHQKRNPHHWQYWVCPQDDGGFKTLKMPDKFCREMVCDWWGASMAQGNGGRVWEWYEKNKGHMLLHPHTRTLVENHVGIYQLVSEVRQGETE